VGEKSLRSGDAFDPVTIAGSVLGVTGKGVEISDRLGALAMHARVEIETASKPLLGEIVALKEGAGLAAPFGPLDGVARGARATFLKGAAGVRPSASWLGRAVNGHGHPVDGKGPLLPGPAFRPLKARPPAAAMRARLGGPVDFGVKALTMFTPARAGQRMGVFSGSGLGKSALLGLIARNTECDAAVIALIGERGREVREFLEDYLGPEGLARSVVIVATSDEPALMRRDAAYLALSLAEHFRDGGAHVLCLMDSLTRVAMAIREIALAAGEPPATKGYPPSVFAALPALVERAGPGPDGPAPGCVTGVFSVLVEGDDHDEPIADACRAILDGHIVLDRKIAERGRFPAVNILRSLSRATLGEPQDERAAAAAQARALAGTYEEMREMIRIGAYRSGANEKVDRAIALHGDLEDFLAQPMAPRVSAEEALGALKSILEG